MQMLLIQTLFSVLFYVRRRLSYPLSGDMIILCVRLNRLRVMVDFMRDPNKFQIF